MMGSKTKSLIIFIVMVFIGVVAALFRYNQEGFSGSRIKNSDYYLLDIERMNGTDLHTLELQTGDVLQIQFETLKGSLYMEIKAQDGTTVYSGNILFCTEKQESYPEAGSTESVLFWQSLLSLRGRERKGSMQY